MGCAAWLIIFRTRHATAWLAILAFAWGYAVICKFMLPQFAGNHAVHFTDGKKKKIVADISTKPFMSGNRVKFVIRAVVIDGNDASGTIRLTVLNPETDLHAGDRISFRGKLRRPSNFNNPGGFDYERYMAFQGLWVTSFVKGGQIRLLERSPEGGMGETIEDYRGNVARLIDENASVYTKGVLKALIVGDKSGIEERTLETFRRAGAGHILAISGLHIGIVATVSFFLFKLLFSFIKTFLWNGSAFKSAALLSVFPVLAYGAIAGMSPSTQRAVIMVSVFLLSFLAGYERDTMYTVALAALAILVADPPALFSISFQLSFSAVIGIIYGMNLLVTVEMENRAAKWIFRFVMVSVFAILGTLPLAMYYFNHVSFAGIVSNFVMIPFAGFATVSLGLLGVFTLPAGEAVAGWFVKAASHTLWPAMKGASLFANLPYGSFRTPTPTILEICCYYALLWSAMTYVSVLRASPVSLAPDPKARAAKRIAQAAALAAALALIIDIGYWAHRRYLNGELRITVMDVGQGSAALVEAPFGPCVMIDGGGFYFSSVFDVGENIVAPFLWRKKIRTVETIILSHPHADHMNGLAFIAGHFHVKDAFLTDPENPANNRDLIRNLLKNGARMPRYKDIPRVFEINGAKFSILHPPRDFRPSEKPDHNNDSMVVKVAFGDTSVLFPGDIESEAERELAALRDDELKSDILIAPHHGSRTSGSREFLEKVDPDIVIISCGQKNRFGYPHPSAARRYNRQRCRIFRTDLKGAVELVSDGKTFEISTCLE